MSELFTLGRVRLVAGEDEGTPASGQPKRMALLAYLALGATDGVARRDTLLALFWPELGDDEGRRALRQALHYLRRVVGDVFVSEGDEVGIRPGALRCDAVEFERLVDAGRAAEALALYRGDYLEAFHVDDVSPDYEEWVERMRARLRRRAATAAWTAADAAEKTGRSDEAIELARRGRDLEPDHEAGWRRLMTLHERLGDRAGALREFDELTQRLARDFDTRPAPETIALAESIRTSSRMVAAPDVVSSTPSVAQSAASVVTPIAGRPRSRRRPFLLGALGAAAVVVGGWFTYVTLRESDSEPSLLARGALAAKDRLLVANFVDKARDTLLTDAVTEAFRIDLSQSALVRVLTPREVRATLARMEQSADRPLNDSVAREVAVRNGAKAIVTGSVAKVGDVYTVNVQLVGTEQGEGLAAFRETASDSTKLITAVDRVSKRLRRRIGESLRDVRDTPPLEAVTTGSLDALRIFTQARRLMVAGRRSEAVTLFDEAIKLDTAFAAAYVSLSLAYASIAEPGRAAAALEHAVAHQRRLPLADRTIAVASRAVSQRDFDTAIGAYNRLLERYPDDFRALNNLAIIYRELRQFAVAESLWTRAATIDSTIPNIYFGIHSTQLLQGNFVASRRTLDLIERRFPGNPISMNVEFQDAGAQQRWDLAQRHAEALIATLQSDTLSLVDPFEALAAIVMTQGRLAEAERYWRTQLALSAASGSRGRHLYGLLQLAYLNLRYRNDAARALALVDSSLAHTPLDSVLPADRPYDELARFYAAAGRLTRSHELMTAAETNDRLLARDLEPDHSWTRGVIAVFEGRVQEAERELRRSAETHPCPICPLPDLARAYDAAGKRDAAMAAYDRYVSTPWVFRYETDASELGRAFKRLAELYEARGDAVKANAMRVRLIQLWQRADPALRPILQEAQNRLQ